MLEDDYSDVIRKASVGCGLTEGGLIDAVGIDAKAWQAFLAGDFDLDLAKRVAFVLKLNAAAFAKHPIYHPRPVDLPGVTRMELPFGSWGVNAWWIEKDGDCIVFDTGTGPDDFVEAMPKPPQQVFITHGHHDHVGGVDALRKQGIPIHEPGVLEPNQEVRCGALRLVTCDLSGHYVPSLGYHIDGLDLPVLVVGDALFAGTMGKTPDPARYQRQLKTLRAALEGLPDHTVLLPGHGPATTVGEERASNPFL